MTDQNKPVEEPVFEIPVEEVTVQDRGQTPVTAPVDESPYQKTVEALMETVKDSMVKGNNVYLRGFGSFVVKKRAKKTARNISKNTTIIIPAHNIPSFKPAKSFITKVKSHVKK